MNLLTFNYLNLLTLSMEILAVIELIQNRLANFFFCTTSIILLLLA